MMTLKAAKTILAEADLLYNTAKIEQAYIHLAAQINQDLAETNPLILVAMNGGLIPAGQLLPRLTFPFTLDYLHPTRYQEETSGGELVWHKRSNENLKGRVVLIIDDILDEGYTLSAMVEDCLKYQPQQIFTAVLTQKDHQRGNQFKANFIGLSVQDRYIFGCGMDYKGYWRQLNQIYAVKGL